MTAQRVRVRAHNYRGVAGWLVSAGPRFRVFFELEHAARRVAALKRENPDYELTLDDFEA